MSADHGKAGKGRAGKFFLATLFVAAAAGATSHPVPRRLARTAVDYGRAWSKRQLDRSLQAPVIKSQGERWRAMHPDA
jgi:hypothetical protein